MNVLQTSEKAMGQIYLPAVNWTLLAGVVIAVVGFHSSTQLGFAYGVAVAGTMLVDTLLAFFVIRYGWHYKLTLAVFATAVFAAVDLAFFSSALLKTPEGGWFTLSIAAVLLTMMLTWRRGREILRHKLQSGAIELRPFLESLLTDPPHRCGGTAVFMIARAERVPRSFLHNLSHNKVLHERVIFLTVVIEEEPRLTTEERLTLEDLGGNCWVAVLRFGFMEPPDVPAALAATLPEDMKFEMMDTSFFLSREKIICRRGAAMATWREHLFATMLRNAGSAVDYFRLPPNRVVEVGTQVEI